MNKDIFGQMGDMLSMAESMLGTLSEKMEKQAKYAKAYEDDFAKRNKLYKAFSGLKVETSIDEAEDFAVHILGAVLAKKTAGQTEKELEKAFRTFSDKLMGAIMEFREHYSYLLALGVASKKQMKE